MFGTPHKRKMLRIGQIVAYEYEYGVFKIAEKFPGVDGWDCDRYTIENKKTGQVHCWVRDKDLMTKTDEFFNHFAYGG